MQRNTRTGNPPQRRVQERIYYYNSLSYHFRHSWPAVVFGCIGLLSGTVLIVWNEARAVMTTKSLEESISAVTKIFPDETVDSATIGKLIYTTGPITVQEPLTEMEYGISVQAVKLKRRVQMYQWIEEESQIVNANGDISDTSYYYYTDWKDKLIDSSSFEMSVGHWNPKEMPIKSQVQVSENVRLGNYILGYELKNKFSNYIEITSDERPERRDIKLHFGLYYHAQDLWNPEVGDIRIQFSYAGHDSEVITVVGKLDDTQTIVPYKTKAGLDILILKLGLLSIEEVFAQEHAYNRVQSWLYRVAAWFLLYMGCICLGNITQIIVYRFRILRDLLPTTNSSLKMTISVSLFLLVTALAWIWYRPILGMGLVVATLFMLFLTKNMSEGRPNQSEYNRVQ